MTLEKIQEALKGGDLETAQTQVQDLRSRFDARPDERSLGALLLAAAYYEEDLLAEAEVWALRALQGDLRVDALCLLGEVAWERLDYESAIGFYEKSLVILALFYPPDHPNIESTTANLDSAKAALASSVQDQAQAQ